MTVTAVYADGRAVLMDLLKALFPGTRFCTSLPDKFETNLPVCRVQRIGGGDQGASTDQAVIDLDCFDTDEITVEAFASQLRTALTRNAVGYTSRSATIADIGIQTYGWRPYQNVNVRSVGMTVVLTLHNHA